MVHKTRSAVLLADMEAPSTITVRLINYTPSELHIRQLKSSTIGVCTCFIPNIDDRAKIRPFANPNVYRGKPRCVRLSASLCHALLILVVIQCHGLPTTELTTF